MAAATSSLLLISPSDECLASLQEALLACAGQSGSRRLTLTTRYYTAAIELVALPAAAYLAPAPGAALASALPPGAPPAEALVLVLDGAQPLDGAALAAASAWAARCAEAALATLLVVSVGCAHLGGGGAPPSAAAAAHLAAAQAWALDHGFEHVEALCSQPALGAAGREKFSVPRVLEALEATLWGCAVMHAPSAARAGAQLAAAGGSADAAAILDSAARLGGEGGGGEGGGGEEGGEEEGEAEAAAAGAEQRGYRAPELHGSAGGGGGGGGGVTLEGEEVEALRAAMQALLPAGAGEEGGGSGSAARPAQGAAAAAAAAAASQFEGLLGQALSIRNAAKDGSMSDAARREAASAMMEKLMAALGLEGEEEEEEEEEEGGEKGGAGAAGAEGAAAAPEK